MTLLERLFVGIGAFGLVLLGMAVTARMIWAPYWIPSGHMKPNLLVGDFVLACAPQEGVDRDNALDSRVSQTAGGIGFVPMGNIEKTLRTIVFSSAGDMMWTPWTWRSGRMFQEAS